MTERVANSGSLRHSRSGAHRRTRLIALIVVGAVVFALSAMGTLYAQLQSEVETLDVGNLVKPPPARPSEPDKPPSDPSEGQALNILIIGSDSRADGAIEDSFDSVLADTHIIAHISADRNSAVLVSIPRDIMVNIPDCETSSGEVIYGYFGMYNEAYAMGWQRGGDKASAVACDLTLAQSATGLTMDGFVLVEMGGFVNMVDALGGVDICIPEPINAPKANLVLDAGQQVLGGHDALGYARARVGVGDGSDPGRIERQQRLMSAMVDGVLSKNVLTDSPALYQMLRAALSSLTVSQNLSSLTDMAGLAFSLRNLSSENVTFITTPFTTYLPDPNRLLWTAEVEEIWESLATDTPLATGPEEPEGPPGTEPADGTDPEEPMEPEEPADSQGGAGTTGDSAKNLAGTC